MAETEHITVAETSSGVGGSGEAGHAVDLPVVELLTGRGFVTGKSGSGKSNTASVVAENLLDNGFGLLIVDIDGEYYGLKEAYEILHAGADEECDIQVTTEHAEKIAALALEENVPIILDISSFLDQEEAENLLTEVARHLFAKAKKQKQPFLLLVEEIHEWIPEQGSTGEVGQMLIKIGKRGRKHGLGMVGISQRPADVKKDYITQCDWLVWHRLTWNNDTKVVGRIIDSEYADAVEQLDDGEAFLQTDWSESIRRVQFHRKQTFDAGATPGLDDFERPELKSVSDDLVSELTEISEAEQRTQDRIAELREELDEKNSRIAELERELQDARDLSRMAEQFTDALLEHVEGYNPGRTEQEKMRSRRERFESDGRSETDAETATGSPDGVQTDETSGGGLGDAFGMFADDGPAMAGGDESDDAASPAAGGSTGGTTANGDVGATTANGDADETNGEDGAIAGSGDGSTASTEGQTFSFTPTDFTVDDGGDSSADTAGGEAAQSTPSSDDAVAEAVAAAGDGGARGPSEDSSGDPNGTVSEGPKATATGVVHRSVLDLQTDVRGLAETTRRMLAYYLEQGADTPLNAHFSAGGSGDRTTAYAHNRELRTAGFVEHVGRGNYDARLHDLVEEEAPDDAADGRIEAAVAELRDAVSSRRTDA